MTLENERYINGIFSLAGTCLAVVGGSSFVYGTFQASKEADCAENTETLRLEVNKGINGVTPINRTNVGEWNKTLDEIAACPSSQSQRENLERTAGLLGKTTKLYEGTAKEDQYVKLVLQDSSTVLYDVSQREEVVSLVTAVGSILLSSAMIYVGCKWFFQRGYKALMQKTTISKEPCDEINVD